MLLKRCRPGMHPMILLQPFKKKMICDNQHYATKAVHRAHTES